MTELDRLTNALRTKPIVVVTGGDAEDRQELITEQFPEPHMTVDAANHDTIDSLYAHLEQQTDTPENDDRKTTFRWMNISNHLSRVDGTLIILNFDSLSDEDRTTLSQNIKGAYEDTDACIAITSPEEEDAIYRGNPDLSGRAFRFRFGE